MSLHWYQPHMHYAQWKNGRKAATMQWNCSLISDKIRQGAVSHIWQKFYERKVWKANIKDVQWLTIKLAYDSEEITSIKCKLEQFEKNGNEHQNINNKCTLTLKNLLTYKWKQRLFKIPPEQHKVSVTVTPACLCDIKETFKSQMTMFPVNINMSSTGHK